MKAFANIGFIFFQLIHLQPPFAREELDVRSNKSVKLPHGVVIALGALAFLGAVRILASP